MKNKQKIKYLCRQNLSPALRVKYKFDDNPLRILKVKDLKMEELPIVRPGSDAYQESLPEFKKLIL